ncbi:hypothetical protein NE237_023271 [Protea cynaroides]|uniref:Uncharacterized protein n=1 Tax=Protea cynaroides TaxID=273540 RepID=A0A9Q0K592_9MAGN|nr:hypothetical protein NE237_023271 [Protea cynaroides]
MTIRSRPEKSLGIHLSTSFCSSTENSFCSSQALQPDIQLQRGQLYFSLPLSSLRWEASEVDFACLATRLTKIAKRTSGSSNSRHSQSNPVMGRSRSAPERILTTSEEDRSMGQNSVETMDRERMSVRARSWKPFLETINEKSFGRRTDSSLRVAPKSFKQLGRNWAVGFPIVSISVVVLNSMDRFLRHEEWARRTRRHHHRQGLVLGGFCMSPDGVRSGEAGRGSFIGQGTAVDWRELHRQGRSDVVSGDLQEKALG